MTVTLRIVLSTVLASAVFAAEPAVDPIVRRMRGFGEVAVTTTVDGPATDRGSWTVFTASDAPSATRLASKRLADLLGFGGPVVIPSEGLPGTVLALDGVGAWLLGVRGAEFHEVFTPTVAGLRERIAAGDAARLVPVVPSSHPRWLDGFDNSSIAIWVGGGGESYDVARDFPWLKEHGFAMCTLSPGESRLVAPGTLDTSISEWHTAMAAKFNLPYRALLFPERPAWAWNSTPLPYVIPEAGRVSNPFLEYQAETIQASSEPIPATDPLMSDFRRRLAGQLATDPNFMGWHGCTETPNAGILELAAVAGMPVTAELWRTYLKDVRHYGLEEVSRLHTGDPACYRRWSDIPVPLPRDFLGWDPATCSDLRGTWQMRPDRTGAGLAAGWFKPEASGSEAWHDGSPNDVLIGMYGTRYNHPKDQSAFWMRRMIRVKQPQLANLRYLHIARSDHHGNFQPAFSAWLNGKPLTRLTTDVRGDWDQCFAVGDALTVGDNLLVLDTHGSPIPGYVFLGPQEYLRYPHLPGSLDQRWFDAVNFSAWLRIRAVEERLRSIRAVDPDRPLKLMSLVNLLDLALPLCERYGAYNHDTGGASGYWSPMTGAKLARLHGLPWSCEQGNPPRTAEEFRKSITLFLLYGNDALDLVFDVGAYSRQPQILAWIEANRELLRCIGKMDLPTPPVGILRSTRNTRLGFDQPWNWDLGRGTLQAVGRTYSYLETPDLTDGKANAFQVVIDDGTLLLTEEDLAGIEAYVRQGGVFVAQHHTGRHSPGQADAWPITRLAGVDVHERGESRSTRMRFTAAEALWPQLRGHEVAGRGWMGEWAKRDPTTDPIGLVPRAAGVEVVAAWVDGGADPQAAITLRHLGKGMVIMLGTTFMRDARDGGGAYRAPDSPAEDVIDELLNSLAVPRVSRTGVREVWGEHWLSKNGIFDLYQVGNLNDGTDGAAEVTATAVFSRSDRPLSVVDIGALGHPPVAATWQDGRLTLPPATYAKMQSRVFAAPRTDRERGALSWFIMLANLWPELKPVPEAERPAVVPAPVTILPLADGWKLSPDVAPPTFNGKSTPRWALADASDVDWRTVRLGAFGTLGIPEEAIGRFTRTVEIPTAWAGSTISLVFDAERYGWGLLPSARLWIDGQLAPLQQPIRPNEHPGFAIDVSTAATSGKIHLALEIEGPAFDHTQRQYKPNGVTGLFYLRADPPPLASRPLDAQWYAAVDYNELTPVGTDEAQFVYCETSFTAPADHPAGRLFLSAPGHLGCLVLNGHLVNTPPWMRTLDISGLVTADGSPNILRWSPEIPYSERVQRGRPPQLMLEWRR